MTQEERQPLIYLDHNATTPIAPEVLEAMRPYLTTEWGIRIQG
jgi:cysteine desulfurase